MKYIDGYKTYISAVLMIINGVLYGLNVYDLQVFLAVGGIITGGAMYAVRDAIKKVDNN